MAKFIEHICQTRQDLLEQLQFDPPDESFINSKATGTICQTIKTLNCNLKLNSDWINGKRIGRAFVKNNNTIILNLRFVNGQLNGDIILYTDNDQITVNYNNGIPSGNVKITSYDDLEFEGLFVNGKANGIGTYVLPNGIRYEGMFVNGIAHGAGKLISENKTLLASGTWKNGCYKNYVVNYTRELQFILATRKENIIIDTPQIPSYMENKSTISDYETYYAIKSKIALDEELAEFVNTDLSQLEQMKLNVSYFDQWIANQDKLDESIAAIEKQYQPIRVAIKRKENNKKENERKAEKKKQKQKQVTAGRQKTNLPGRQPTKFEDTYSMDSQSSLVQSEDVFDEDSDSDESTATIAIGHRGSLINELRNQQVTVDDSVSACGLSIIGDDIGDVDFEDDSELQIDSDDDELQIDSDDDEAPTSLVTVHKKTKRRRRRSKK